MTRGAGVARRKGHIAGKNQTRNNVARGVLRGRTFGKRLRVDPEGSTGVRNLRTIRRLHLGNERTAGRIFGETFKLEVAKRIAGYSVGLRKITVWTVWGGRPPPKRKQNLLAALAFREPVIWEHQPLGRFCPHRLKRKTQNDGDTPGSPGTLSGSSSGQRP
jgi:hypothetical protein